MTDDKQLEAKTENEAEHKGGQKRLGVMSMSVTIKYEDGFSNTVDSGDMIVYRPSQISPLAPNQRPTLVKAVNIDAVEKSLSVLKDAVRDVENTRPTDEQISEAKKQIEAQQSQPGPEIPPGAVPVKPGI